MIMGKTNVGTSSQLSDEICTL